MIISNDEIINIDDTETKVTSEENGLIEKLKDLQILLNTNNNKSKSEEKFKQSLAEYILEKEQKKKISQHDDVVY
jgi:hypothetical protein